MTCEKMDAYCKEIKKLEGKFYGIEYTHVVWDKNKAADESAMADVEKLVCHCDGCQFFMKRIHVPAHEIQTIPTSWPFAWWGLDMIGPLS
jgi:hypothetical protein